MMVQTCSHARYVVYINIPNLCENLLKKAVSEKRKCQFQGHEVPLTRGFAPGPHWGLRPKPPLCNLPPPPAAEGLDPPLYSSDGCLNIWHLQRVAERKIQAVGTQWMALCFALRGLSNSQKRHYYPIALRLDKMNI